MLRRCNGLAQAVPPESTEHGQTDNFEVLQELGSSCRSLGDFPAGDTGLPTPGLGGALARQGANTTSATEVLPSEGNEARQDERQEVIAS